MWAAEDIEVTQNVLIGLKLVVCRATITLIVDQLVATLPSHDPVFIICRMAIFQNTRPPFTSKVPLIGVSSYLFDISKQLY